MAQFERLRALINLSREERFLEYKESRSWNDLKGKIARTAMGMANIRDSGTIIVGCGSQVLPGFHRAIKETLGKEWALRPQELVGSAAEFALEPALWFLSASSGRKLLCGSS